MELMDCALGLTWKTLRPDGPKAHEIANQEEKPYGVMFTTSHGAQQVGLSDDRMAVGQVAAAGLLALLYSQILYAEQIGEGDAWWVCAIEDAQVLPGFDFVGPLEVVRGKVAEVVALTDLGRHARGPAAVFDMDRGDPVRFADLIHDADRAVIKKVRVTKVQGGGMRTRLLILGVLGLAGAGAGGWWWTHQQAPVPEVLKVIPIAPTAPTASSPDPAALAAAEAARQQDAAAQVWSDFQHLPAARDSLAAAASIFATPLAVGGWQVQQVSGTPLTGWGWTLATEQPGSQSVAVDAMRRLGTVTLDGVDARSARIDRPGVSLPAGNNRAFGLESWMTWLDRLADTGLNVNLMAGNPDALGLQYPQLNIGGVGLAGWAALQDSLPAQAGVDLQQITLDPASGTWTIDLRVALQLPAQ